MASSRTPGCTTYLALLAGLLLAGCTTPKTTFMQVQHREDFAIQDDEILRLQFYISTDILARNLETRGEADSVVVMEADTPGVATEVGPDRIRVSFRDGSDGVYFLATDMQRGGDAVYWLATEVPGRAGLQRVMDLDEKVLVTPDGEFELLRGYDARLLVSLKDLERLIEGRAHVPGRKTR
jgi:hypothetical protein